MSDLTRKFDKAIRGAVSEAAEGQLTVSRWALSIELVDGREGDNGNGYYGTGYELVVVPSSLLVTGDGDTR